MNKNKYTMITGGSEGIGKGFAFECAGRGMNILLVALPGTELKNAANELKARYSIKVETLAIDLTEKSAPENVFYWCKENNYSVNILINNAGVGGTTVFDESTPEYSDMRIQLNIRALVLLCRYFIPEMKNQPKAYILNVSSLSAFLAIPYKSVYVSTKAFILHFSKAIRSELYDSSISVSVVCPNGVVSNQETSSRIEAHGKKGKITAISIEELAKTTIREMLEGKATIIPKFVNKVIIVLVKIMPSALVQNLLRKEFKKEVEPGVNN
ncbi:MAG: short-chain dehydrogenase [Bacteroidetes bacterium]|nr:MAG: short-chain dehydrogenase [Bacteroidota bacterium]